MDNRPKVHITKVKLTFTTEPIVYAGWAVKVSVSNKDVGGILVIMTNIKTFETVVRFFTSELDAHIFIEMIVQKKGASHGQIDD